MGTSPANLDLQTIQQLLSSMPDKLGQKGQGAASALSNAGGASDKNKPPMLKAKAGQPAALFGNAGGSAEDVFNAMVYTSQVEQMSLSVQMQEARARVAAAREDQGQTQELQAQTRQLTFDFFAESRTEELITFNQRTSAVADGLKGARQETFIQASQSVSMRFSMSLTVSGASLNGFAGAAEALQGNEGDAMDQLIGFAQDALDKADEVLNEVFGLLNDMLGGGGDLRERLTQFFNNLNGLGLFGEASGGGGEQVAQMQQSTFTFQLEFQFQSVQSIQVQAKAGQVEESDPIVFDLDGDGIELTSYRDGARFDIQGNGREVNTAFVTGGDAFLAIDRNGNGSIDSGRELFGDQNGAANGYEELRKLDSNGDGRITADDRDFGKLLLFKDNGNGKTEDGELVTLAEAGISEISLDYLNVKQAAAGGNRLEQIATFLKNDGSRGRTADAILNFTA